MAVKRTGKVSKKMEEQMKAALDENMQYSEKTRDDSGLYGNYFTDDGTVSFFDPKEGIKYVMDIVPFIAGEKYPSPTPKTGKFVYVLMVFVHRHVGPSMETIICPALTRKYDPSARCPICEDLNKKFMDGKISKDEYDNKKGKRRCVYNVWVHAQKGKGPQVFEVSHWLFEKELMKLKISSEKPGVKTFNYPSKHGKSINFTKTGQGTNQTYTPIEFVDRSEGIPAKVIEMALCLDELVHWPEYKELWEKYHGKTLDETRDSEGDDFGYDDSGYDNIHIEQEEEEAATEESGKGDTPEGECPHGHEYGVDCLNAKAECDGCNLFGDCVLVASE